MPDQNHLETDRFRGSHLLHHVIRHPRTFATHHKIRGKPKHEQVPHLTCSMASTISPMKSQHNNLPIIWPLSLGRYKTSFLGPGLVWKSRISGARHHLVKLPLRKKTPDKYLFPSHGSRSDEKLLAAQRSQGESEDCRGLRASHIT